MYHEKEFVRRDETGNFVFSRLHRTERETEVVQSITGRTRPVGTPHGTALRCLATSASGRTNRPAIHRQEAPWKTGENAHFQAETDGNVHERAIMHTPVFGDTYLCIVIRMTRELQNQKTNF